MFGTTRGMLVPAGKVLLAFAIASALGAPLAARADDGLVDVRTLPRLEGAVEDTAHTEAHSLRYGAPTPVAITSAATRKLFAANGWVPFLRPTDERPAPVLFKKGKQGLDVSFTQGLGRPDRSVVHYLASRITSNVPFPPDATSIVFDESRPYLGCVTAANPRCNAGLLSDRARRHRAGGICPRRMPRRVGRTPIFDESDRGWRARLFHPCQSTTASTSSARSC